MFWKIIESIKESELKSEHLESLKRINPFWQGFGSEIITVGLSRIDEAELRYLVGSLMSNLGLIEQYPGAQESARDELSKSERLFKDCGEIDKSVFASSRMGLAYCRSGEYAEAIAYLKHALPSAESNEARAHVLGNIGATEYLQGDYVEALAKYQEAYALCDVPDHINANSLNGIGISSEELAKIYPESKKQFFINQSIDSFDKAIDLYKKIGNRKLEASTEKNLGELLYCIGDFAQAKSILETARDQHHFLRDFFSLASSYNLLLKVHLATGNITEAVICGANAVKYLEKGDNKGNYAHFAKNYAIALSRSGKDVEASVLFNKSLEAALYLQNEKLVAEIKLFRLLELFDTFSWNEKTRVYSKAVAILAGSQNKEIIDALKIVGSRLAENQLEDISDDFETIDLEAERIRIFKKPIEKALKKSGGNITKAAQMLSLTRGQLRYELKNYPNLAFKNASGRKSNIIQMPQPSLRKIRSGIDFSPIKKGNFVIYTVGKWSVGNLILLANKNNVPVMGRLLLKDGFYYLQPEIGDNIILNESDLNYILGQVISYQNSSNQIVKI